MLCSDVSRLLSIALLFFPAISRLPRAYTSTHTQRLHRDLATGPGNAIVLQLSDALHSLTELLGDDGEGDGRLTLLIDTPLAPLVHDAGTRFVSSRPRPPGERTPNRGIYMLIVGLCQFVCVRVRVCCVCE